MSRRESTLASAAAANLCSAQSAGLGLMKGESKSTPVIMVSFAVSASRTGAPVRTRFVFCCVVFSHLF